MATLLVDILRRITRQGRDHLDFMFGEIFRQPAISCLLDDGEVVAVDDLGADRARRFHQVTEEFAQLRRAAGEVHDRRTMPLYPFADA